MAGQMTGYAITQECKLVLHAVIVTELALHPIDARQIC